MHRTGVLLAALAVVLAGCGSSSSGSPGAASSGASSDHTQAAAQTELLTKAVARFKAAGSGTYESQVTLDGISDAIAHETGSYRLDPVAAQLERAILGIDQSSSKARVQVVRVRSLADRTSFLQLKEWGSWAGCWLQMDLSAISRQTGVDMAGSNQLPTAVGLFAKAKVAPAGDGMDTPHLTVDAYSALQFLGVSASAISAKREALGNVAVPVLLDVTADGAPSGAKVDGNQVSEVLKGAGLTLSVATLRYIGKADAEVVLGDLGKPVHLTRPPADELLPRHPAASSTCTANR